MVIFGCVCVCMWRISRLIRLSFVYPGFGVCGLFKGVGGLTYVVICNVPVRDGLMMSTREVITVFLKEVRMCLRCGLHIGGLKRIVDLYQKARNGYI